MILSSGYSINHEVTAMMERGCRAFIQKPLNIGVFSKKIRGVLGGREMRTAPANRSRQLPLELDGSISSPSTLNHYFGRSTWIGRGDVTEARREFPFHRQSQKRFRQRRKACGPALNHEKTTALWFREARRCPRPSHSELSDPLSFPRK